MTIFQRSNWLVCPGFSDKIEQITAVLMVQNISAEMGLRGLQRTATK